MVKPVEMFYIVFFFKTIFGDALSGFLALEIFCHFTLFGSTLLVFGPGIKRICCTGETAQTDPVGGFLAKTIQRKVDLLL